MVREDLDVGIEALEISRRGGADVREVSLAVMWSARDDGIVQAVSIENGYVWQYPPEIPDRGSDLDRIAVEGYPFTDGARREIAHALQPKIAVIGVS